MIERRPFKLLLGFEKLADNGDDGIELGELLREPDEGLLIRPLGQLRLYRFPARDELVELLFWNSDHDVISV